MLLSSALCLFFIAWSSAFLLDFFLRQYNVRSYIDFAERIGLVITPFQLRLYTSRVSDDVLLNDCRHRASTFLSLFYSTGTVVSLITQILITLYLSKLLWGDVYSWLFPLRRTLSPSPSSLPLQMPSEEIEQARHSGLVPIVPGVNLPLAHIPVFMAVLIVAAVLHEVGHGLAARVHGVRVNGFGIFLIAIYPGAFTDIDTNSLQRASTWTRLQIFSAGIWHNLLLALLAFALFFFSSTLLSPVFALDNGIMITGISPSSGLYGGLNIGDVVVGIDNCQVRSSADWRTCIDRRRKAHDGKCVAEQLLLHSSTEQVQVSQGELHCCDNATSSHLCFESPPSMVAGPLVDIAHGVVLAGRKQEPRERMLYSCLNARRTLQMESCNKTSSCSDPTHRCAYAALFNGTRLVQIMLADAPSLLFVGNFDELLHLVDYSPLTPRFGHLPLSLFSPLWLPNIFELITKYMLALSLALGAVNALPCIGLDGKFLLEAVINSALRSLLPKRRRRCLLRLLLLYGTCLLAGNVIVGFSRLRSLTS